MIIWHIDDDPIVLEIASRTIRRNDIGSEVRTFEDARKALAALDKSTPDIILLDMDMPGMDGWEFLEALAKRENVPPIFILTASLDTALTEKALKMPNVKGLLTKPLTIKDLATLVIG
ncbi:MAG: response regulator [Spirochaetia bacterium]|nr:response regulator [Spirochaetia bacterium]